MVSNLYLGALVRLAALDPEKDAPDESRWTHDPDFLRLMGEAPARPLSAAQLKRRYEKAYEEKNQFHFGLRALDGDRLVGVVRLRWIEWNHGTANLEIGIGDPADRGRGYGSEGLALALRYAFDELNLHRLTKWVAGYNTAALRFFQRAGFRAEVRLRQAARCDARRWDRLLLGLRRDEWRGEAGEGEADPAAAPPPAPSPLPNPPVEGAAGPSLFTGQLVRLAATNHETDAGDFARWSHDAEFMRLLDSGPARIFLASKNKEEMEKADPKPDIFPFVIRALEDDRLLGFVELDGVRWPDGDAWVGIGIGSRADWGKGYGTDAMQVILRYAFTELNLHRVTLNVFEYNPRALRSYRKAGFTEEGRLRGALHRDGRRWDMIFMGILRQEWQERSTP